MAAVCKQKKKKKKKTRTRSKRLQMHLENQHAAGLRLTHARLLGRVSLEAWLCFCHTHTHTHLSVMVSRSPLATPFITVLAFGVRTTWETKKVPFLLWETHQVRTKTHSYGFFLVLIFFFSFGTLLVLNISLEAKSTYAVSSVWRIF